MRLYYAVLLRWPRRSPTRASPCAEVPGAAVRSRDLDRSRTAACLVGGGPIPGARMHLPGTQPSPAAPVRPIGQFYRFSFEDEVACFYGVTDTVFSRLSSQQAGDGDGLGSSAQPIATHLNRLGTSAILCHDCKNVHLDRLRFSSQDSEAFRGWFPHRHAIRIGDSHNAKIFMAPGPVVHSRRS